MPGMLGMKGEKGVPGIAGPRGKQGMPGPPGLSGFKVTFTRHTNTLSQSIDNFCAPIIQGYDIS